MARKRLEREKDRNKILRIKYITSACIYINVRKYKDIIYIIIIRV